MKNLLHLVYGDNLKQVGRESVHILREKTAKQLKMCWWADNRFSVDFSGNKFPAGGLHILTFQV